MLIMEMRPTGKESSSSECCLCPDFRSRVIEIHFTDQVILGPEKCELFRVYSLNLVVEAYCTM
jgi:hypothetical protein